MNKFIILLIIGLLTSCVSHKGIVGSHNPLAFDKTRLTDALDFEESIGSADKTPNHHISISTEIYPNKNNHKLATPRTFLRDEGFFEVQVRYYYSSADSSVKVIMYQWDKKDMKSYETQDELKKKFKKFKIQWRKIATELNKELGLPKFKDIRSTKYGNKIIEDNQSLEEIMAIGEDSIWQSTAWRDQMKWKTNNLHAYLFMFGDNRTGYRQIQLAIYGE